MAMAALAATRRLQDGGDTAGDKTFLSAKLATARFYADNFLSQAEGLSTQITRGGMPVLALASDDF
jgi:butyryl-CoA dehydrogenase